eukprot:s1719_g14.t1
MTLVAGWNFVVPHIQQLSLLRSYHSQRTHSWKPHACTKTLFTHSSASVSMSSPSYNFARNTSYSCTFIIQNSFQRGTAGTRDLSKCPITDENCPQVGRVLFAVLRFTSSAKIRPVWTDQTWQSTNTAELILHKYGRKHRFQMHCLSNCVFLSVPFAAHKASINQNATKITETTLSGGQTILITGNDLSFTHDCNFSMDFMNRNINIMYHTQRSGLNPSLFPRPNVSLLVLKG